MRIMTYSRYPEAYVELKTLFRTPFAIKLGAALRRESVIRHHAIL